MVKKKERVRFKVSDLFSVSSVPGTGVQFLDSKRTHSFVIPSYKSFDK